MVGARVAAAEWTVVWQSDTANHMLLLAPLGSWNEVSTRFVNESPMLIVTTRWAVIQPMNSTLCASMVLCNMVCCATDSTGVEAATIHYETLNNPFEISLTAQFSTVTQLFAVATRVINCVVMTLWLLATSEGAVES
jgi:hypothetical protein